MSARAVAGLTVLVVGLAGLVWWSFAVGDGDGVDRLLADVDRGEVAGLDLVWQGEVVVLDRRGDDGWTVSVGGGRPRPAEPLAVERFLGAVLSLGPGRALDDADPEQTGLDRPRGRIALRGPEDEVLATLDLGAPVPGAGTVVVGVEPSAEGWGQVRAVSAAGVVEEMSRRAADRDAGWRKTPPAETPSATEPSVSPEEPSRNWTELAPAEVDRMVLDSALLVGDEPLDIIRGRRDWVVVDAAGRSVPFPHVSDLLRAVTTARVVEREEMESVGDETRTPVLLLTLADAPGARRETLTLWAERSPGAPVVPAASTARPGVVLLLGADTARAVERSVREVAAAVSDSGVSDPGT